MSDQKYQETKKRKAFRFMDLNHDGYVARHELINCGTDICRQVNATPEETRETCQIWGRWCDMLFFPSPKDQGISEEDFVRHHNGYFEAGRKQEIVDHNITTYGNVFDRVDLDKDGKISRDELGFYYHGMGAKNENFIDKVFKKMDLNGDGFITKDEFVKAGVEYWTSDDPNSGYEFIYDIE